MALEWKKGVAFFSSVLLLLLLNVSFVQGDAIVPSITITGGVPNTCSSSSFFSLPVFWNVTDISSDHMVMSVQGVGTVSTYSENDSLEIGAAAYGIPPQAPYTVADGTPVTITITTYKGQNQTGGISFVSTIVFACDTGNVISLQSGPPPRNVPTMNEWGMILFSALAGFGSMYYLRRQKRANS